MAHTPLPGTGEDQSVRWQKIRFQAYGIATLVVALLIALNIADQATTQRWLEVLTQILNIVGWVIPLIPLIAARKNSDPKNVSVISGVAAADVEALQITDGSAIAGPAADETTGTVMSKPYWDPVRVKPTTTAGGSSGKNYNVDANGNVTEGPTTTN